jgi:hypothetical protein
MRRTAVLGVVLMMMGGCATVPVSWQEQLKSYPLIELGQTPPADGNYVVHLPAGKPVPIRIMLEGDIFTRDTVQDVHASPRRDIYFYKDWMSFDMKSWRRTRSSLKTDWDMGIPGYKNPKPGHIKIIVNERKE